MGTWEDPGNYIPVKVISAPGKITEKIILGATERQLKNKANIRHSQHGSSRESPALLNSSPLMRTPTWQMKRRQWM